MSLEDCPTYCGCDCLGARNQASRQADDAPPSWPSGIEPGWGPDVVAEERELTEMLETHYHAKSTSNVTAWAADLLGATRKQSIKQAPQWRRPPSTGSVSGKSPLPPTPEPLNESRVTTCDTSLNESSTAGGTSLLSYLPTPTRGSNKVETSVDSLGDQDSINEGLDEAPRPVPVQTAMPAINCSGLDEAPRPVSEQSAMPAKKLELEVLLMKANFVQQLLQGFMLHGSEDTMLQAIDQKELRSRGHVEAFMKESKQYLKDVYMIRDLPDRVLLRESKEFAQKFLREYEQLQELLAAYNAKTRSQTSAQRSQEIGADLASASLQPRQGPSDERPASSHVSHRPTPPTWIVEPRHSDCLPRASSTMLPMQASDHEPSVSPVRVGRGCRPSMGSRQ